MITPTNHENWQKFASQEDYIAYMNKLQQDYEKITCNNFSIKNEYTPLMGRIGGTPSNFGLWMPGVALVVRALAEKNGVENAFVAKSMEAFAVALRIQLMSHQVLRMAFIVSPNFSGFTIPKNFPQHKVTVVFEKNNAAVKWAMLDSMPVGGQRTINVKHLTDYKEEDLWDGYEEKGNFNAPELISRAFFRASKDLNLESEIYCSHVIRQRRGGCAMFSINDSLSFLLNPNFFKEIKCEKEVINFPEKKASFRYIETLPPLHMVGVQSIELLEEYQKKEPELSQKPFPRKIKTLKDSLNKSFVKIEEKQQNHYTTKKEIKYYTWVVNSLKEAPDKVESLIAKTLCTNETLNM